VKTGGQPVNLAVLKPLLIARPLDDSMGGQPVQSLRGFEAFLLVLGLALLATALVLVFINGCLLAVEKCSSGGLTIQRLAVNPAVAAGRRKWPSEMSLSVHGEEAASAATAGSGGSA
jgi:hypothetical protein